VQIFAKPHLGVTQIFLAIRVRKIQSASAPPVLADVWMDDCGFIQYFMFEIEMVFD
jgi:hypothetical protein